MRLAALIVKIKAEYYVFPWSQDSFDMSGFQRPYDLGRPWKNVILCLKRAC